MRPGLQGDADHLVGDRHLEVQRLAALEAQVGQQGDVGVADVAAILAQVGGDAVGAGRQGQLGGPHRLRIAGPARVADRGHVVDVDAEPQHGRQPFRAPAARILDRDGRQLGRQSVGRIGGDLQAAQRHQRHADIDLAARTVDDAGRRDHVAAGRLDRLDALARRQAGGDDVLDHHDLLAGLQVEAAAELEAAALALDIDRGDVQPAGGLVAGDDPARRPARPPRRAGPRWRRSSAARALHKRSQRSGRMNTRFFCRKTGLCRPEDSTKWPSRRAPAARNSSRTSSLVMRRWI